MILLSDLNVQHPLYIPRLSGSFCGKPVRRGITQVDKPSLRRQMRHRGKQKYASVSQTESFRAFQGASAAFSQPGDDDKLNVVFLRSVFITPYVGAHNRLMQATRSWLHATHHSYLFSHCGFLFPYSLHRDTQGGSRRHQDHYGIMSLIEP